MFTYLVTSYRSEEQIVRLVTRLRSLSPEARLVLSHDPRLLELQSDAYDALGVEVIRPPRPVTWGNGSYLDSLVAALTYVGPGEPGDWLTILTSQDYPLHPLREYEAYLTSSGCDMLLEEPPPSPDLDRLMSRYQRRAITLPVAFKRNQLLRRVLAKGAPAVPGLRFTGCAYDAPDQLEVPRFNTPFDAQFRVYKGADQFALGHRAMAALLGSDQRLLRYFRKTHIPTEGYFHTVLLNDQALTNCPGLLHYMDWGHGAHPGVLDGVPVEVLRSSRFWFARKFSVDAPVLDALDLELGDVSPGP